MMVQVMKQVVHEQTVERNVNLTVREVFTRWHGGHR